MADQTEENLMRKTRVQTVVQDVFPEMYKSMISNSCPPVTLQTKIKKDMKFLTRCHVTSDEKKILQTLENSRYSKMDGVLMYKVIRYFNLVEEPTNGWNKLPAANHIKQGDDVERMRQFRNKYAHLPIWNISDNQFEHFFNESIEIASRLDEVNGHTNNGFKNIVTRLKTSVFDENKGNTEKPILTEKKFFKLDSGNGRNQIEIRLFYGNDIINQFASNTNEEVGKDHYKLEIDVYDKETCQMLIDYLKKYGESCRTHAINTEDIKEGSVILHISIDRKSFTSCETLHHEIQLYINTIFRHKEMQWKTMSTFNMVLSIADYTEQVSEIENEVDETSLQTTEATAAIEEGKTDGIPPEEICILTNESAQTASRGIQFGITMEEFGVSMEEKRLASNKIAQAATGASEIGIKVDETSLQTTKGTSVIDKGIQIAIPIEEKVIKANKGTETAKEGSQFRNPIEEKRLASNRIAQAVTRGEAIGIPLEEISMITKRSDQAATKSKQSEIGIKVEETSLQTNTGTAAIEGDIQIGIVMAEKDFKSYKSTKEAEGAKTDIQLEEICISTNERAQTASRGEEIGMITKQSEQAATQVSEIGVKVEETNLQTNKGTTAIDEGEDIGIPPEEIGMITKRSEQAPVKGNLDFKEIKEKIAVLCTKTTCKTELVSGSNFCHKCGQEINKKQGILNSNDFGENIPMFCINTNCKTELVCGSNFCHKCGQEINKKQGSKIVSPILETSSTTDQNGFAATENKAMLCTYSTCKTELLSGSNFCHKCGYEQQIIIEQGIESDLKMAQAAKDKVFKSLDIDEIANTLVSGGTKEEFRKIYQEKIESWKVKDVKFCITGASRTGKSSFINAITGCQKGQKGFATVSVYGDTTNKAACYTHPKHSKFQLWDLPGFGTVQHKSEGYVSDMEFTKFDYVLIFFDVISENDIWLAKQLKRLMKSFCFVRSKLDQDKTNEMQHDCNTIACNIRTKALGDLEKEQISGVDVFVISSADTTIGNFESLINHMENNLDEGKYAAVIYSLASISKPVIGEKFKVLHKRISMIAVVSMLFKDDREITTHSRSDIILTNLKNEIMFYINTFELTPPVVQKLMEHSTFQMRDILCRSGEEIKKIVKNSLESKNEKIFSFPQMPSLFRESEILLNTILVGLQNDALYVFGQLPTFKGKVVEQENISVSNV